MKDDLVKDHVFFKSLNVKLIDSIQTMRFNLRIV